MLRKFFSPLAWYAAAFSAVMLGCATPHPSPKASAPAKSAPGKSAPVESTPPDSAPAASLPAPGNVDGAPTPAMRANVEEKEVLVQTNVFRREHGLSMLRAESRLMEVARRHAANMARKDRFGDTNKNGHVMDGLDPAARVQFAGYSFSLVAENVGWQLGKTDPVSSMVEGWKNSPGHRKNLLIPEMSDTGVGAAKSQSGRWYFVQVFGKPFESTKRTASRKVAARALAPGEYSI
ncbi:MAG: CAP domain-containing protein [Burkholderiales bacterium]